LSPNLRIRGHLPAPIIAGEETAFENNRFSDFQGLVSRDRDLRSGHTAYHHASLIDLYLHTKFHWNRRNFFWTDGRTDIFLPIYVIRSTWRSRPINVSMPPSPPRQYQIDN